MKPYKALSLVVSVLLWSGTALAQDAVKADPSHYKVVLENASVRVLKIDYAPGSKSTMHQHPDAIVVMLGPGKARFTTPDGKSEDSDMPNESAQYSAAETHNPENVGKTKIDALLVEFKSPKPGTAAIPTSRPDLEIKTLAEGPRGVAYRTTASPTFHEPAGSKHDFDQVIIALGPSKLSLSLDGKPAKTTWARGEAQFIGRGVPHESQNTSGKPVDFIIVAIK